MRLLRAVAGDTELSTADRERLFAETRANESAGHAGLGRHDRALDRGKGG
jgi:hypothetical protein